MSEQIIRRTGRIVDIQATMPWLVAAGVYVLLLALGPRLLADPDTYSHVALGRWILEHHTVPTTDPFSATLRGTHWVAFEWLSQVTFAAAYAIGGWTAVVVLSAAAVSIAIGLLTRFLLREWQPIATLAAVLIAFLLTAPHILARPHILALPIMVAWITTLIRAVDTRSAPPLLLIPLMTLWANLHGSFTFGLAMVAPIACDAIWRATPAKRMKLARQWALFGVLALAAACINPYGPEVILVTFRTVALGAALTTVTEWRPQDFSHIGTFELLMLAAFGFALYRGVTLPLLRIVMVFGVSAPEPLASAARRSSRIARAGLPGTAARRTICSARGQPNDGRCAARAVAASRSDGTVDRHHRPRIDAHGCISIRQEHTGERGAFDRRRQGRHDSQRL